MQAAAKKLAERGIATGGHKIFKQLREIGMLRGLHPSLHAEHMGWLIEKRGDWDNHEYCRVFITYSGLDKAEFELQGKYQVQQEPKPEKHEYSLGVGGEVKLGF